MEPNAARGRSFRSDAFWLGHVRLGLLVSAAVILVIMANLALTPDRPNRPALWLIVGSAGALTIGLSLLPWRRLVNTPIMQPLLAGWTFSLIIMVVVFATLDGERSPFGVVIVLPLVFASMAYPPLPTALVGCAVVVGQVLISVLDPGWDPERFIVHVTVLASVAVMAGVTARNHERSLRRVESLAAQLEELAHVDQLTGCLNRRGFHARLDVEVARAERNSTRVALLHADLDHFKRINDQHGHPAGDQVLTHVGATLLRAARVSDAVGRLGGEEFAIVLPDTSLPEAEAIAERIREEIAGRNDPVPVTISIGVSSFPVLVPSVTELISSADRAMYEAKRRGRDRVVTAAAVPMGGHADP